MIKVIISDENNRKEVFVPADTTIDAVFAQAGIALGNSMPMLNGQIIQGQTNKSLSDFGVDAEATLVAVRKMVGANH